jgi:alpha-glucosidase
MVTFHYFFLDFVKMSTNITPIISCNVDENGEFSPYNALDSGKASKMLVVNQREGQPPALDANGNEEFFIGNVNYGRGMLTWGHYPDLGRPEVQKWWGDQYKVSTSHSH